MSINRAADDDDQRRFQGLVEPHLGSLLRFARRRTAAIGDAEDAVQETCLRAWTAFGDLRDEAKARAWLYRILRTVLSDGLARDARRTRIASTTRLDEVPETDLVTDADVVFSEVVARLSSEAVYRALASIPPDFAAAVEMHDIDGLKYHEVAEALGVPLGTVMSRISRGRRLLARAISARVTAHPMVTARPASVGCG